MVNHCIFQGRLVADPELRRTPENVSVVSFRIAVQRNYAGKDGQREADFFNVVAWRKTAEFISKFFAKGQTIIVIGSMQNREYTDKDGNKRYVTELIANEAQFCDSKSENGGNSELKKVAKSIDDGDGELPF